MQTTMTGWGAIVLHRQMELFPVVRYPRLSRTLKLPKERGHGKRKKEEQDLKKVSFSLACHYLAVLLSHTLALADKTGRSEQRKAKASKST